MPINLNCGTRERYHMLVRGEERRVCDWLVGTYSSSSRCSSTFCRVHCDRSGSSPCGRGLRFRSGGFVAGNGFLDGFLDGSYGLGGLMDLLAWLKHATSVLPGWGRHDDGGG